jgi:hypothetical protein
MTPPSGLAKTRASSRTRDSEIAAGAAGVPQNGYSLRVQVDHPRLSGFRLAEHDLLARALGLDSHRRAAHAGRAVVQVQVGPRRASASPRRSPVIASKCQAVKPSSSVLSDQPRNARSCAAVQVRISGDAALAGLSVGGLDLSAGLIASMPSSTASASALCRIACT